MTPLEKTQKRLRRMNKDTAKVKKLAEGQPVGQLLFLMQPIIAELVEWSSHRDFTREQIIGLMIIQIMETEAIWDRV